MLRDEADRGAGRRAPVRGLAAQPAVLRRGHGARAAGRGHRLRARCRTSAVAARRARTRPTPPGATPVSAATPTTWTRRRSPPRATQLRAIARERRTAVMCAEAMWWQCHRGLIADDFKARGWEVMHLLAPGRSEPHPYTSAARIVDGRLDYSAPGPIATGVVLEDSTVGHMPMDGRAPMHADAACTPSTCAGMLGAWSAITRGTDDRRQRRARGCIEAGVRQRRRAGDPASRRRIRFRYVEPDGKPVRDRATLARIRALAIPPAYTDVWICTDPRGHLQATGRDARGRKQYRYHPRLARSARRRQVRAASSPSATRCRALRRRLAQRPEAPRACRARRCWRSSCRLLAETLVRVGNDEYARSNSIFGLTTLRNRHVRVPARRPRALRFRGKSGQDHEVVLDDAAPGAAAAPLPAAAGAEAVPVPRRRRHAAAGRLRRRQRLPARGDGRGLHRQGFPHLGRHAGRVPAAGEDALVRRRHRRGPRHARTGAGENAVIRRWPSCSATRRRSAARPTSIRPCSPAGATAACSAPPRARRRAAMGAGGAAIPEVGAVNAEAPGSRSCTTGSMRWRFQSQQLAVVFVRQHIDAAVAADAHVADADTAVRRAGAPRQRCDRPAAAAGSGWTRPGRPGTGCRSMAYPGRPGQEGHAAEAGRLCPVVVRLFHPGRRPCRRLPESANSNTYS